MTNSQRTTTIPGRDGEWINENPTRRIVWTTDTTECANCESTFRLDNAHYYVTLRGSPSTTTDVDSREIVFCSRSCADKELKP